ncbi:MAG: hypothetical protein IKI95_01060 [Clostridia bacterium]|nr:hypothetical protein [Clostridia bacterium]
MENIELLKASLKEQKCKNKKLKIELDLYKCALQIEQSNSKSLQKAIGYWSEKCNRLLLENNQLKGIQ